jgi:hypothetical protein
MAFLSARFLLRLEALFKLYAYCGTIFSLPDGKEIH